MSDKNNLNYGHKGHKTYVFGRLTSDNNELIEC